MASFSLKGALSTGKTPNITTAAKGVVKQIVPPQIKTAANIAATTLNKSPQITPSITKPSAAAIAATRAAASAKAAAEQAIKSSRESQTVIPTSTGKKPPPLKTTTKKAEPASTLISQPVAKTGFFASLDGLPMWQKILGGLGLIGVVVFGAKKLGKKKV